MTEAQRIARRVRIAYDRFHRTGNAAPLAASSWRSLARLAGRSRRTRRHALSSG
jgi:hypothetical protein